MINAVKETTSDLNFHFILIKNSSEEEKKGNEWGD